MYNLVHPGKHLYHDIMMKKDMSFEDMSDRTNIEESVIRALCHGDYDFDSDIANRVAEATGTTSEYWLRMQHNFNEKW